MTDKKFLCHVISEIVVVFGLVYMFFQHKRKVEARVSELEKKLAECCDKISTMQKIIDNNLFAAPPQPQQIPFPLSMPQPLQFPSLSPMFKVFENIKPVPISPPARIVSFEELVGSFNDEDDVEIIDKEIASELAELEEVKENNLEESVDNNK